MATGRLISDELLQPSMMLRSSHPTDSSRILLGLMSLARQGAVEGSAPANDNLDGVISKDVLRSLLSALHFRDVSTVRHTRRTAMLAVGVAQHLGWDPPQLKVLEVAALLHDVGKIGVPDNILFKPGKLSADEAELMALHHNIGVDVLQACHVNRSVLDIVINAHSFYNGATDGFNALSGNVPLGARILSVADAYDSLATDQVYRKGKSHDEIMKILLDAAGTQFDGNVVCALQRWIESEGLPFTRSTGELSGNGGPSGPAHPEETLEASWLCHIFSYLYVLESLYDGFYMVNSDMKFVVWNRGIEKLLGFMAHDILEQNWSSRQLRHAHPNGDPLTERESPMQQVITTGTPGTSILKIGRADGRWVDVEVQSVPIIDAEGGLHGVAQIFRDLARSSSRRPQEYRELKLAASRDALTQVANRGELEAQLAQVVTAFTASKQAEPASVIFLDIDFFKSINDTYGHAAGDRVLVDLARLLQHEMYSGELVGRYGGEEFVVLCPSTNLEQATRRAERLRLALYRSSIGGLDGLKVSASFGVAELERGDNVDSLLRRADKALYTSKENGRNCTTSLTSQQMQADVVHEEEEDTDPDPFVLSISFRACVAADMIVFKLGGFVTDNNAKLLEVTNKRASMRIGQRGLLPFWGSEDNARPVDLDLELVEDHGPTGQKGRSGGKHVMVNVRVRPVGWIRDSQVFQNRARRVVKLLRAFFAAD